MLFSDLREVKSLLGINPNDNSEDKNLNFLLEMASQWIEEILNRPGMSFKSRTEYYAGTNSQQLLLRSRPVSITPTPQVFVDDAGFFGARSGSFDAGTTALTYGTDFALALDPGEDGKSRSGILVRINQLWPKPSARQRGLLSPFIADAFGNIKVVYSAGYFVDDLPASLRLACNLLVQRINYIMPLGVELHSESYEERAFTVVISDKEKLLALVKPLVLPYRNWKW